MTIDMSRYLGIFVTEATEHLEALGRDLVQLEKEKDSAAINSMFRHAHSVKGMAASMGFEPIATLAHRVEDLVDAVRTDPSRLSRELVDLVLASTDAMLVQVKATGAGQPPEPATALLTQLSERLGTMTGRPPEATRVADAVVKPPSQTTEDAQTPRPPSTDAPKSEAGLGLPPRYGLKLKIAASCQVPGVRAFLVYKRLSTIGNVFDLKPPLEDLKAGRIPDGLIALELESSAGESGVLTTLKNVADIELVSIKALPPPASGPATPTPAALVAAVAAATPVEPPRQTAPPPDSSRTVRVRTELLDYFLDTVGELLLATARIREVGKVIPAGSRPALEEAVDRLHGLVKDLHDKVMSVRMTPLSVITDRLPRAARDIARRREREVDLAISGAEIELDRAIIDEISDPLLHILRNCIDHGIESPEDRVAAKKPPKGKILFSVRRQRERVVLEIEDDGRGMSPAKLKDAAMTRGLITAEAAARMTDKEAFMLACLPGVSTAKDVSEISGRGVGMDSVKRSVENVGGTVEIESERGRGARFTLRLPLTVAVVNLLLVEVGDEIVGLPIAKVIGASEADPAKLSRSRETVMLPHGSGLLPVHSLAQLLNIPSPPRIGVRPYIVMEADPDRVALEVDRLLGQEEVVLKALSRPLDLIPGLSGVTILGSGRPVFILDVPRLLAA
ncbi:MAG: ATP-binding protein [Myxococcaceae bacterium]